MTIAINVSTTSDTGNTVNAAAAHPVAASRQQDSVTMGENHTTIPFARTAAENSVWNRLETDANVNNDSAFHDAVLQKMKALIDFKLTTTDDDASAFSDAYRTGAGAASQVAGDPIADSVNAQEDTRVTNNFSSNSEARATSAAIMMLLITMFMDLKKGDMEGFLQSLDRTKTLLDTMLSKMSTQISKQQDATNWQSSLELVFSVFQIAMAGGSLLKTSGLAKDRNTLLQQRTAIPADAKQLASDIKTAEKTTSEIQDVLNDMGTKTPASSQQIKANTRELNQISDDTKTAAAASSAISDKVNTKAFEDHIDDQLLSIKESIERWHQVQQTSTTLGSMGHATGGLAAAPVTAESQTAGKGKEEMDNRMQLEQQSRSLLNGFADTFTQVMASAFQAYEQSLSTQAEAAKAPARAA